jgi:hypothetical protein
VNYCLIRNTVIARFLNTTLLATLIIGCGKSVNEVDLKEKPKDYLEYGNVVTERLVGYYPFDGNAKDYSGYNNNGLQNGVTASTGRFGQSEGSYFFDGIDDYIKIPSFYKLNGDSGTVCFWARIPSSKERNERSAVISKIDTVGPGYVMSVYGNSSYWFMDKDPTGAHSGWELNHCYWQDGQYFFLAVTFEVHRTPTSKTTRITRYFDGLADETTSTKSPTAEGFILYPNWSLSFNSSDLPLYIGKCLLSGYEYFVGEIDDLLIYDRALSESEILELYKWK